MKLAEDPVNLHFSAACNGSENGRLTPVLICTLFVCLLLADSSRAEVRNPIEELVVRPNAADADLVVSSTRSLVPPVSVTDLLQSTPAVALVGQGGHLQTFAIRGLGQERIRVLFNDAPLRPLRRAGVSVSFLNPDWIVVSTDPTANPTTQGSGNIGGTVFTTPLAELPDRLALRYETPGSLRSINASVSDNGVAAALGYQKMSDQDAADGTRLNTSFQRWSAMLRYHRSRGRITQTTTGLFSQASDIGKSNSDYPQRVASYPLDRHLFVMHELSHETLGHVSGWLHAQKLQTKVLRDAVRSDVDTSVSDFGMRYHSHPLEAENHRLRWGLDVFGRGNLSVREDDTSTLNNGSEVELGAYLNGSNTFGRLSVNYGLRTLFTRADADDQSNYSTSKLLGRAGIAWWPSASTSLQINVHRATTAPNASQLFYSGVTGRGQIVGNDDLKTEDAWIYEFGGGYSRDRLKLSVQAFYMDMDSFIEKLSLGPDIDTFSNADGGDITGLDGELRLAFTPITLAAGFTVLRGEVDGGGPMRDIPANQATLSAQFALAKGTAAVTFQQRFASTRIADGNRKEDARTLLNASYRRSFGERFEATIYGRNLLNELYYLSNDDKSSLGPERSLGISLSLAL